MANSISVWRPFEDLMDVAREFERDIYRDYPTMRNSHYLNIDVDVTEDSYIIKTEVPGLSEDDINIHFENGMVTIEAEYSENSENVFRKGRYARSFSLRDIDPEKSKATLRDGILKIELPKLEEAKARQIKITK